jgi:lysophospholipase L1-like esterase
VALGDSYTAAPLVSLPAGGPPACLRSTGNYPSIVARELSVARHRDVSCSAASTVDMTARQSFSGNDPQFDALDPGVRLVTLGIGFNDAELGRLIGDCPLRALFLPSGSACRDHYAPGGRDSLSEAITATAPKVAAVLQGIHRRAPRARVVVLGYPSIVPKSGRGCWPLVPLSEDNLRYFDELLVKLNAALAEQAADNDAEYADSYSTSLGHDVCAAPGTKWWEGAIPASPALPWHPNALGVQHLARSVLDVLAEPRPAPVLTALSAVRSRIETASEVRFTYALNRPAAVTVGFRRELRGRREGGRCRSPSTTNRRGKPCKRFSRLLRTVRVDGLLGDNGLVVSPRGLTTPGRYSATATAAGDQRAGPAQTTHFRVTGRR